MIMRNCHALICSSILINRWRSLTAIECCRSAITSKMRTGKPTTPGCWKRWVCRIFGHLWNEDGIPASLLICTLQWRASIQYPNLLAGHGGKAHQCAASHSLLLLQAIDRLNKRGEHWRMQNVQDLLHKLQGYALELTFLLHHSGRPPLYCAQILCCRSTD